MLPEGVSDPHRADLPRRRFGLAGGMVQTVEHERGGGDGCRGTSCTLGKKYCIAVIRPRARDATSLLDVAARGQSLGDHGLEESIRRGLEVRLSIVLRK